MVLTLADMDGQETFEASALGTAEEVGPYAAGCMPVMSMLSLVPPSLQPRFHGCANYMASMQVVEESVADDDMVMIRGSSNTAAVSVLLRGANDYMLDEMDRSLHDAFCVVKRVLESGKVVPGAQSLCIPELQPVLMAKRGLQQTSRA